MENSHMKRFVGWGTYFLLLRIKNKLIVEFVVKKIEKDKNNKGEE